MSLGKKFLLCAAFAMGTNGIAIENRDLGSARIIERVYTIDYAACEQSFEGFLCYVKQYDASRAKRGLMLEPSNPRCILDADENNEGGVIVAIEVDRGGYMISTMSRGEFGSIEGDKAKGYIKRCLDSLAPDAIKALVIATAP